jgi:hypothetical protein
MMLGSSITIFMRNNKLFIFKKIVKFSFKVICAADEAIGDLLRLIAIYVSGFRALIDFPFATHKNKS